MTRTKNLKKFTAKTIPEKIKFTSVLALHRSLLILPLTDVESSSGIEVHLFCERNDTKSYRIRTRSKSTSLTENNIVF